MASTAYLESRFPEIIAAMDLRVEEALAMGADAVVKLSKDRCPVGATGNLKDSIHAEAIPSNASYSSWQVVAGNSEAFYGHMVENGTSGQTAHPPHPFLVPSFEELRPTIVQMIEHMLLGL